jgi:ATP-dependent Clp protease ATP-binding subunit ClpB
VGYEEGGQLTEAIRRRPYSVVLLDEVEKAHREVLNVLLQVFDEGRLTDGLGRLVDFRNTIVVMTSNVGSEDLMETDIDGTDELRERLGAALRRHFSPEFLNRLDDIVWFNRLRAEDLHGIVRLQVEGINRMLHDRGFRLELTEQAVDHLATQGWNPAFGARPVRRTIQKLLMDPLASKILGGEIHPLAVVGVGMSKGELTFQSRSVEVLPTT